MSRNTAATRIMVARLRTGLVAIAISMAAASGADARVVLRNGNYYIVRTDISFNEPDAIGVERTYNSMSNRRGLFGEGWGSTFDTNLEVDSKGLFVRESGTGATNRFRPGEQEPAAAPPAPASLAAIKPGDRFFSTRFGYATIERLNDKFVRHTGRRTETFDLNGRLVEIATADGRWIRMAYDGDALRAVTDSSDHALTVTTNDNNSVMSIASKDGKTVRYEYNRLGELVAVLKDDVERYGYSRDGLHNLTSVQDSEGGHQTIWYHPDSKVRFVRDLDGPLTEYRFDTRRTSGLTEDSVVVLEHNGANLTRSAVSYYYQTDAAGDERLIRMIERRKGEYKETTYSKGSEKPILVETKQFVRMDYDARDRVTLRETPETIEEYGYDPAGLVTSVVRRDAIDQSMILLSARYDYDAGGHLLSADSTAAGKFTLTYDSQGRIEQVSNGPKFLRYSYNDAGKPSTIATDQSFNVTITYGPDGSVSGTRIDPPTAKIDDVFAVINDLRKAIEPSRIPLEPGERNR